MEKIDIPSNNNITGKPNRLRTKARILKTLGEELISNATVALIELVKNAYDADAKNVLIDFSQNEKDGSNILTVYDDGHGMTSEVVEESWMVIATSSKKQNKQSQSGTRRVLGEKGIGRFATSRLAKHLELCSRVKNNHTESYTVFDWTQFDDDELYLDEVQFYSHSRPAENIISTWRLANLPTYIDKQNPTGTVLKMLSLKDAWDVKDFKELQRGLSRLVSPFSGKSDFNIYLSPPESSSNVEIKIQPPELIKYPHYSINGKVNADGSYNFDIIVEYQGKAHSFKGNFYFIYDNNEWKLISVPQKIKLEKNEHRKIECGEFGFEFRIWDRDQLGNVEQKLGTGIKDIRKDLDSIAGINIYRDGFRVLPYGEPNNDWLRLDIRRVQKPSRRLSNNQITGYISITADANPELQDLSNREGLDNNTAYFDLTKVIEHILNDIENIRAEAKKKPKDPNDNNTEQPGLFDSPDFESLKNSVNQNESTEKTIDAINKIERNWKKQVESFKNVLSQYHALATLGGIVDKVLHDGRQPLSIIQTEAGLSKATADSLIRRRNNISLSIENIKNFFDSFHEIVKQASIIGDVFRRVEPFGGRKRGRPAKYYIEDVINDTFKTYSKELTKAGIICDLPATQTLVSIDITELSEILTNLLTNSMFWLNTVPKEKRIIKVGVSRLEDGALELIFSDSGPGIESQYKHQIFEPYFSKRPDGHGLGLCLVGEIVKDYYNGSVELLDTGRNGGASFRIVLRRRV
ncbi:sensor histidine kinase [Aeromonas caviae]|uniref:sensor histidine kinase n=1 Tax=Aeromonas caviae TaxID=648 RepID=UPI003989C352